MANTYNVYLYAATARVRLWQFEHDAPPTESDKLSLASQLVAFGEIDFEAAIDYIEIAAQVAAAFPPIAKSPKPS